MYKVLIVDDEKIVRIALSSLISWKDYGLELIGTASDGNSALEMIQKEPPQIIITDLKMPGMDGIRFIETLNKRNYAGKIIVLSNYSDFELVRKSMKLGAYDYLLKLKLNSSSFTDMMRNVIDALDKDTHNKITMTKNNEEYNKVVKNKFMRDFLKQSNLNTIVNPEENNPLGITYADSYNFYFRVLLDWSLISPLHVSTMVTSLTSIIVDSLGPHYDIDLYEIKEGELCVILKSNDSQSMSSMAAHLRLVKKSIEQYTNQGVTFFIGGPFKGLGKLKDLYAHTETYYKTLFYSDFGTTINGPMPSKKDHRLFQAESVKLLETISSTVDSSCFDTLANQLDGLYAIAKNEGVSHKKLLSYNKNIIELLNKTLLDFIGAKNYMDSHKNPERNYNFLTLKSLQEFNHQHLASMAQAINIHYQPLYREDVQNVITYIHNNLSKKLKLEQIANHVSLNESYLCRIFKQDLGMSIMAYINEIRMEKAGKLLLEPHTSIKEIAYKVGYHDPLYFNKAFKKYFNMNPTTYKKNKRSEN